MPAACLPNNIILLTRTDDLPSLFYGPGKWLFTININSFLTSYQEEEVSEYLNQRILAAVRETDQKKVQFSFSRQIVKFSIAATVILSFVAGILFSDIAFNKAYADTSVSELDFGQNTLYSYFDGGE